MGQILPSFKLIDTFQAVADSGSIERAATMLNAKPTTVSQQLKLLEAQLGVILLDRSKRPLRLTKRGKQFLLSTTDLRNQYRQVVHSLHPTAGTDLAQLSLAIIDDFNASLTPALASTLAAKLPRTKLTLLSGRSDNVLDLLSTAKVDAAITAQFPNENSKLSANALLKERLVLVSSIASGLSQLSGDRLKAALMERPYIAYEPDSPLGRLILQHLKRLRLDKEPVVVFDNNLSIFEMVKRLDGWTITTPLNVLSAVAPTTEPGIVVRELPFTDTSRTLWLLSNPELSAIPLGSDGQTLDQFLAQEIQRLVQTTVLPLVGKALPGLKPNCVTLLADDP